MTVQQMADFWTRQVLKGRGQWQARTRDLHTGLPRGLVLLPVSEQQDAAAQAIYTGVQHEHP